MNSVKYALGYTTSIVFLISLSIYMYLMIIDYLEKDDHTSEEYCWIYGFFVLLLVGFIVSIYSVSSCEKQIKLIRSRNTKVINVKKLE